MLLLPGETVTKFVSVWRNYLVTAGSNLVVVVFNDV